MSAGKLDLLKLKAATYDESDWLAIVRVESNTIANLPVFFNRLDEQPYVAWRGQWVSPESLDGFQKYIELPPAPKNRNKTLFNPHTRQAVDTGLLPDEFEREREQWKTLVH